MLMGRKRPKCIGYKEIYEYVGKNAADGESYAQAMLGIVTATGQAILQTVAAIETQCFGWSFAIYEVRFDGVTFLS
jgi:hypothetical protein